MVDAVAVVGEGTVEPDDEGTDGGIVVEGTGGTGTFDAVGLGACENVAVGLGACENVVCGGCGCDVWVRTWVRSCCRFAFC